MTKRLIYATLAGTVVMYLLGWLVWGVLLADYMSSYSNEFPNLMKDMKTPSFMIFMLLSILVQAFLVSYIFQRWGKFMTFWKGLNNGLFFGFFLSLMYDLSGYAMMNLMTVKGIVMDVIVGTIMWGIMGGIIAWILGFNSKAAPAQ